MRLIFNAHIYTNAKICVKCVCSELGVSLGEHNEIECVCRCARKAPQLVKDEFGVLPLARLAVWVPLENWVRSVPCVRLVYFA